MEILEILKELGSKATGKQIRIAAKIKYPNYTTAEHANIMLSRLFKAGTVGYDYKTKEWYIIDDSPLYSRNIVSIE